MNSGAALITAAKGKARNARAFTPPERVAVNTASLRLPGYLLTLTNGRSMGATLFQATCTVSGNSISRKV